MRTAKILNAIIDLMFYILGLGVFFIIVQIVISLVTLDFEALIYLGSPIKNSGLGLYLALSNCIIYILFFYRNWVFKGRH